MAQVNSVICMWFDHAPFECKWIIDMSCFYTIYLISFVCLLVVFNVPSTARSFRDGTPIYYPLRRTWSSINTPFWLGIEPLAVAWQSITLPLRYASSTYLISNHFSFKSIMYTAKQEQCGHLGEYFQIFWEGVLLFIFRNIKW